jgi:hypothetical protein
MSSTETDAEKWTVPVIGYGMLKNTTQESRRESGRGGEIERR